MEWGHEGIEWNEGTTKNGARRGMGNDMKERSNKEEWGTKRIISLILSFQ